MDVLEAQPVQPVSSPGFLAATMTLSGCSNQRKAEYLVRPALERDGGGVSIAQQLLLLLHRYCMILHICGTCARNKLQTAIPCLL